MKKNRINAYLTTAALLAAGIAGTQATAGVLAEGNISVYKSDHTVRTITGQNPVDEEALMVCNDNSICFSKMDRLTLSSAVL